MGEWDVISAPWTAEDPAQGNEELVKDSLISLRATVPNTVPNVISDNGKKKIYTTPKSMNVTLQITNKRHLSCLVHLNGIQNSYSECPFSFCLQTQIFLIMSVKML